MDHLSWSQAERFVTPNLQSSFSLVFIKMIISFIVSAYAVYVYALMPFMNFSTMDISIDLLFLLIKHYQTEYFFVGFCQISYT